ncbi:glycosyltransferase [Nitrospirillum sp. BR 11828]|uniref:glycosyltransferase n=1 Tax=Nitrospirillum sp. BR 11828 TaxID=3104325 RepID=UPI002ACA74B7|nr:glycosyltransferase [Nitrospirillum sp. BR 11828]MDZ5650660.1 glycosyltransferase [Nitrospirillum sp. BR 11828]
MAEVGDQLDLARIHFLGKVPYDTFLSVLRVSAVHVYLTYPFVLSWSLMEALASACLVVASDTAPVREVIKHGQNGLLVDFFSPRSWRGPSLPPWRIANGWVACAAARGR